MPRKPEDARFIAARLDGDWETVYQIFDQLYRDGYFYASDFLRLSPGEFVVALDQVISEATGWLLSDKPFEFIDRPILGYARVWVTNALIDWKRKYYPKQKGEPQPGETLLELGTHAELRPSLRQALTSSGVDDFSRIEGGGSIGWQEKRVKWENPYGFGGLPDLYYGKQGMIKALFNLYQYADWGGIDYPDFLANKQNNWRMYKIARDLLEFIENDTERKIIELYLWNYPTQKAIATRVNKDKAYVSQVITKWIKDEWQWDTEQEKRVWFTLLANYLATLWKNLNGGRTIEELNWDTYRRIEQVYMPEHLQVRSDFYEDTETRLEYYRQREAYKPQITAMVRVEFYQKLRGLGAALRVIIKNADQARFSFEGLEPSDDDALAEACSLMYEFWYMPRKQKRLSQKELEEQREEEEWWEWRQAEDFKLHLIWLRETVASKPLHKRPMYIDAFRRLANEDSYNLERELILLDELDRECQMMKGTQL